VARARLSDALYFWKTDQADLPDLDSLRDSAAKVALDLSKPLDQRMARLDRLDVTFHAKLGTQGERVERIARLAEELAPVVERSLTSPLRGGRTEGPGGGASSSAGASEPPPLTPSHKGEGKVAALARRAAVLAKADLQTEVVGEFPELQGAMGRKYALLQGEDVSVAAAIEDHYRPQGPSDRVPTDPVAIAVALADKLDTLVGFWAIEEKPTGSKDPYALRRAALGVIRILVENGLSISLQRHSLISAVRVADHIRDPDLDNRFAMLRKMGVDEQYSDTISDAIIDAHRPKEALPFSADIQQRWRIITDLLSFFHDRLKVYLRDQGARHDLIDAVLGAAGQAPISPLEGEMSAQPTEGGAPSQNARETPPSALPGISPSRGEIGQSSAGGANDDLLVIVRKVEALGALLETEDGRNLLAGTKRAANILAAEEKKGTTVAAAVDPALFRDEAERRLFAAVNQAEKEARQAIQDEDFSAAMRALAALREPVDSFFEDVLVNDEDQAVRANRLALLARIRAATAAVADFSRIAG